MRVLHYALAALAVSIAMAVPIAAHHSFAAEFDANKPVTVKGTIAKMDWVNPHTWIYVDVKNPDGTIAKWRFEMGPPNALLRMGWRTNTVVPGTEVEISGFRAKTGDTVGNAKSVTLPDGRELFSGGSAPGQEAEANRTKSAK